MPFLKNRPIASHRSLVMSEPRVGVPPNGDISVKSSVSVINARYLSMSPRMSAAFDSADRWTRLGDLLVGGGTRISEGRTRCRSRDLQRCEAGAGCGEN